MFSLKLINWVEKIKHGWIRHNGDPRELLFSFLVNELIVVFLTLTPVIILIDEAEVTDWRGRKTNFLVSCLF